MTIKGNTLTAAVVGALISTDAFAATQIMANNIDIVWVALCAILVFFMQAGFALLEGGCARSKNTVNVIMKNYCDLCVGLMLFWLVGYGLMFGSNPTGWFGQSHYAPGLDNNREAVFFLFQAMFAATAATIVSGAVAERMRFTPYVVIAMFICGLIYPVFGSWAWEGYNGGGGWLTDLGFIDFAGATVVHSIGGWCALAGIIVLGPRQGRFGRDGSIRDIPGHNLPLVGLGVFILWTGWFGFNGGSTFAADGSIGRVLVNTQLAGASGVVAALLTLSLLRSKVMLTTVINGGLGGLVSMTAGADSVAPGAAIVTGLVGGMITVSGSGLLKRLRLDDVVDAVAVHGFCGVWGTLAVGLFFAGDMFNLERVGVQALGAAVAFAWAFPLALVVFYLLKLTVGLRVSGLEEQRGLDFSEHYEAGYPEFTADLTNRQVDPNAAQKTHSQDELVVSQPARG